MLVLPYVQDFPEIRLAGYCVTHLDQSGNVVKEVCVHTREAARELAEEWLTEMTQPGLPDSEA